MVIKGAYSQHSRPAHIRIFKVLKCSEIGVQFRIRLKSYIGHKFWINFIVSTSVLSEEIGQYFVLCTSHVIKILLILCGIVVNKLTYDLVESTCTRSNSSNSTLRVWSSLSGCDCKYSVGL